MKTQVKELVIKGKPVNVTSLYIHNREVIVQGGGFKTARVEGDWYNQVTEPELLIEDLTNSGVKIDMLTFMQAIPIKAPRYTYHLEYDNLAAISLVNYDHWFKTQIKRQSRNRIRNAAKKGVKIEQVDFNDDFIKGMTDIFNETPIRQGKKFWHYGKDFHTIKEQFKPDGRDYDFIGAYYGDELIGFVWLWHLGDIARTIQIISKVEHRDKSPTNALLAKAVEICDMKKVKYLVYGQWDKSGLTTFKHNNGFQKYDLPRYYIPLSFKGKIYVGLNLYKGISGILPKPVRGLLLSLRSKVVSLKYHKKGK
jgi:hypothetical protein